MARQLKAPILLKRSYIKTCEHCGADLEIINKGADGAHYVSEVELTVSLTFVDSVFDESGPITVEFCSATCVSEFAGLRAYLDHRWMRNCYICNHADHTKLCSAPVAYAHSPKQQLCNCGKRVLYIQLREPDLVRAQMLVRILQSERIPLWYFQEGEFVIRPDTNIHEMDSCLIVVAVDDPHVLRSSQSVAVFRNKVRELQELLHSLPEYNDITVLDFCSECQKVGGGHNEGCVMLNLPKGDQTNV